MSLFTLTAILQDGSTPDPGIQQNPRATVRVTRNTDAILELSVINPAGAKVPIELGDELLFTVKRSPNDEAPALQLEGVPVLTTPINGTFTLGAGALGAGIRYYRVSALNAFGETLASAETSFTITALQAPAGIVLSWGTVAAATSYKIYGRSTGAELYLSTVTAPTTTWLDDGSITPAGALPTGLNIWHFTFLPASTMDLDGRYIYDILLIHDGLRDVILPASPFIIDLSPGYRP